MHVRELGEDSRGKRCYVSVHVCVRVYTPPSNPGICRRQNKNHSGAASRQPEIYLHSPLSPGRWMGTSWSPFYKIYYGSKGGGMPHRHAETRRQRDLEGATQKTLVVWCWGEEGKRLVSMFGVLKIKTTCKKVWGNGWYSRFLRESWRCSVGTGRWARGRRCKQKGDKKKIKSFNGNINCCSCGFYKTHKLFSFLFLFFFLNCGLARAPFAWNIQVVWDLQTSYGTQD